MRVRIVAPTGCSLSCGLRQRKVSGQRVRRLQKVAGGGTPTLQPLWAEGSSEPRPFFAFPGIRRWHLCRPAGRFQERCSSSLRLSCRRSLALFGKTVGLPFLERAVWPVLRTLPHFPLGPSWEPELVGSELCGVCFELGRLQARCVLILSVYRADGHVPRETLTRSIYSAG